LVWKVVSSLLVLGGSDVAAVASSLWAEQLSVCRPNFASAVHFVLQVLLETLGQDHIVVFEKLLVDGLVFGVQSFLF
jgi:hypothetical protein